jgi:hypothetical protein
VRRKIRSRIRKLSIELAKSGVTASSNASGLNDLQIWQVTGKRPGTVANAIAEVHAQFKSGELFSNSDKTLLASYFRFALKMNVTVEALRNDPGRIVQLVVLSYQIGHALREDPIVSNPALIRRIGRLSGCYTIHRRSVDASAQSKSRNPLHGSKFVPPCFYNFEYLNMP